MTTEALKQARSALTSAKYAIKGREHTGFIDEAIAALDAALASGAQEAAPIRLLDDPRLQQLFGDAIEGALAFGFQQNNEPPPGHWLWRFWRIGSEEAKLRAQEAADREDAERWRMSQRLLNRPFTPMQSQLRVVETSPLGDEKALYSWERFVDAARAKEKSRG